MLTFSLPHPTMQDQQKRWPHSVTVLFTRSSKQSVQLREARRSSGMADKSSAVHSSSSGRGSSSSSTRDGQPSRAAEPRESLPEGCLATSSVTERSSRKQSSDAVCRCLPFSFDAASEEAARRARRAEIARYINRMPMRTPRRE